MTPPPTDRAASLPRELQAFRDLCADVLGLMTGENQALANSGDYDPGPFNQRRKRLLPQLESALIQLRSHRPGSRQPVQTEEVRGLFQSIESLLMKGLNLDRENQQALLRRGLVPPQHWPRAGAQQPHYVAGLYQQHARIREGGVP